MMQRFEKNDAQDTLYDQVLTKTQFLYLHVLLLLSGAKIAFALLVLLTEVTGAGAVLGYGSAVSPEETPINKISTVPQKKYRCYSHTSISTAYEKVLLTGANIRTTAREYGIPETSLRHRLNGRVNPEATHSGPPPTLSREEEAHLTDHLKLMIMKREGKKTKTQKLTVQPGPSGIDKAMSPVPATPVDESLEDEDETEMCCVCSLFTPSAVRQSSSLVFVHLIYCTKLRVVRRGDIFMCPHCVGEE
ncbi:hypothetical protein DPMN_035575 [Dreissena polymorpha]|uniref:HTH psq-type domain-containing protein n=1 Tax=Dreissena polymorpha TaxID=45954 RepID=A0A9D4M9S6_DREPO|nr:hypothetical protein DPMN_035575 [Dreissena polymorpha]